MSATGIPTNYHQAPVLQGRLFFPATVSGPWPGILLLHEYTGFGDYLFDHARTLAGAGYVVLCGDMYGKDAHPASPEQASRTARPLRSDRRLMRSRARAGLDALRKVRGVDPNRLGALGFSFGGCCALELARCDTRLRAAVSVYGYLNTSIPAQTGAVTARILVLHGAQDKVVPMSELPVFREEMHAAGADVELRVYDDAGHGFCHRGLMQDDQAGSWYAPDLDARAREAYLEHFARHLSHPM